MKKLEVDIDRVFLKKTRYPFTLMPRGILARAVRNLLRDYLDSCSSVDEQLRKIFKLAYGEDMSDEIVETMEALIEIFRKEGIERIEIVRKKYPGVKKEKEMKEEEKQEGVQEEVEKGENKQQKKSQISIKGIKTKIGLGGLGSFRTR